MDAAGPLNKIFLPLTSFLPPTNSDDVNLIVNHVSIINKNNSIWIQIFIRSVFRTCKQMG